MIPPLPSRLVAALHVIATLCCLACSETNVLAPTSDEPVTPVAPAYADVRQKGVSWVGARKIDGREFDVLVENNVNWIVQTPFGWQSRLDDPVIRLSLGTNRTYWGESDEGIESTSRHARERGIRTLLKPHIWVRRGAWPGDIAMQSEEDWSLWFESYREFILHYASLAERNGIEALCIGTELRTATTSHPDEWRRIIREVREVYGGRLTYAANWHGEYDVIEFWDELDFIGVQAYFPLVGHERPTLDELEAGWSTHVEQLERVSHRFGKPIVFTELGYRSSPAAAIEPWSWPERSRGPSQVVDLETQAKCFEAFFGTFWNLPWVRGAYVWKWYPNHEHAGGPENVDFTPQNKPAQGVIARWYGM